MEKKEPAATSFDVITALRTHYPSNAYAFFEQVGNSTGGPSTNWADAVVVGLWPSRGLDIVGIEVKVRRTDWQAELKNPKKAEAIARFCDYWYLAVGDPDIVREGELPTNWGMFVLRKDGKIHCVKAAVKNESPELTRGFIAAVLRRASAPTADALSLEYRRGYDKARDEFRKHEAENPKTLAHSQEEYNRIVKVMRDFEDASGISLRYSYDGKKIGEAVALVMQPERLQRQLDNSRHAVEQLRRIAQEMEGLQNRAIQELGQANSLADPQLVFREVTGA